MRTQVRSVALLSGLRIWHFHECGVGRRYSSDPVLPCQWCRLQATASIQLLAWELPRAAGVALKRQKKKKKTANI